LVKKTTARIILAFEQKDFEILEKFPESKDLFNVGYSLMLAKLKAKTTLK